MPITQVLLTATAEAPPPPPPSAADFTIEWFQKVENNSTNARPWSVGLYPTQLLAVSYEGMINDYYWINNNFIGNVAQNHVGAGWRHMAYVRRSGVVYGYVNGTQYFTVANTDLITDTSIPLYVGTGEISAGTYKGYITNLHIMKGVAKYTGNFTPPTSPIISTTGSVFLMNTTSNLTTFTDSVGGKVTIGVTGSPAWSSDSPFTAYGPYTVTPGAANLGLSTIYISKATYPDVINVQAGWTITSTNYSGVVTSVTDPPGEFYSVVMTVTSGVIDTESVTLTQPGLGSVYFDGTSYVNYGASADWAMDNV